MIGRWRFSATFYCSACIGLVIFFHSTSAQTTVNILPVNATYGSGTVGGQGYGKASGDIMLLAGNNISNFGNGWARFDLSALPSNAMITDITFYYVVTAAGNNIGTYFKGYCTTSGAADDAAVATGATLYNLCSANNSQWAYLFNANGNGAKNISLGATAVSYIQSNFMASPLLVVSLASNSSSITQSTTIAGYNSSTAGNRPYIIVTYTTLTATFDIEKESGAAIYPVPAKESLFINNQLLRNGGMVSIANTLGEEVMSRQFPANGSFSNPILDIAALPVGMYIVLIQTEKNRYMQKIIKE